MKCHFIEKKKKLIIGNYVLFLVPCVLNYFYLFSLFLDTLHVAFVSNQY